MGAIGGTPHINSQVSTRNYVYDTGLLSWVAMTQPGTTPYVSSPLTGYMLSDKDDNDVTKYYGNVFSDGKWYIAKDDGIGLRYVTGANGYTTAWTNRAAQSYDYAYNVTF